MKWGLVDHGLVLKSQVPSACERAQVYTFDTTCTFWYVCVTLQGSNFLKKKKKESVIYLTFNIYVFKTAKGTCCVTRDSTVAHGSSCITQGSVAPQHVGFSSPTRDRTGSPCITSMDLTRVSVFLMLIVKIPNMSKHKKERNAGPLTSSLLFKGNYSPSDYPFRFLSYIIPNT